MNAADFLPPAGDRYARVSVTGSILPGGRIIQPLGIQIETGPGTSALAISPKGVVATADIGPERSGVTLIGHVKDVWQTRHLWARTPYGKAPEAAEPDWKGVASGLAFETERTLWISEGDSGRVRLVDTNSGNHVKIVDLNQGEWRNSFTGGLAYDAARRLIFVLDRVNHRMAVIDAKKGQVVSSVRVGGVPSAIALSPGGESAYVVNKGEPVSIIDVRDPLKPAVTDSVQTGLGPAGVLAAGDRVYVSNGNSDSVSVVSAATHKVIAEIPLRIPGLESLRGIIPLGMAFDAVTGWLLVAEAGINAVGVIDTHTSALIAHIPAGWFPTAVLVAGDRVYVANARGRGTGPNLRRPLVALGEPAFLHHGTVSTFIMPVASELPKLTGTAYAAAGFVSRPPNPPSAPPDLQHIVLIVKNGGTFDEVLGDIAQPNARVAAMPQLARFGMHGIANGNRVRFSVHDAAITPNQHAIARRWAFGDNFYADAEDDDTINPEERPEAGTFWDHLEHNGISFRKFGEDPGTAGESDQRRADRFISDIRQRYGDGKEPLPRVLYILLPNDGTAPERPGDGYPYQASFVEDNDLALGRIVEYLSSTPWWRRMAVFVTETSTDGGLDHVDSHRTLLLAAGPWVRRNFVTHTNSDFPALLKTILQLLHVPPLNLTDATAANLTGIFSDEPDFAPYQAEIPDKRVFDAGR